MKIVYALTALALVLALAGCKAAEETGLSLPSVKGAKDIQESRELDYSARPVEYESEARTLLDRAFSVIASSEVMSIYDDLYASTFSKDNGRTEEAFWKAAEDQNSISYSVKIDDANALRKIDTIYMGTIKTSEKYSWSSNMTRKDWYDNPNDIEKGKGDTCSSSGSESQAFAITDGYVAEDYGYGTIYSAKVAGYISKESKWSQKETIKEARVPDRDGDTKEAMKYDYKSDSSRSGSAMLVVTAPFYDSVKQEYVIKGAKLRFSYASKGKSSRTAKGNSESVTSDLEVYGDDNKLIYTIKAGNWTLPSFFN
jgi:hypothetical protein